MARHILLTDVTIITVDERRRIILDGSILVKDSRIIHVSPTRPQILPPDTRVISLPGRIIIPGLINTHAHLGQSLLRGLAEDLPLHSWLCDRIWPLEAAFNGEGDEADGYVAARLTIAEMLKSGTTCFLEAMLTPGSGFTNVARAVSEMGIRACLGKLVKFAQTTNSSLKAGDARDKDFALMTVDSLLAAHAEHHGKGDDRIHVWGAFGTPRGAPLASYQALTDACHGRGMGMTMHCGEAPADLGIFRDVYDGMTPLEFCAAAGIVGEGRRAVLAHMCHLSLPRDAVLAAEAQAPGMTTVAHNPSSNLKLASGVAPVPELRQAGVNVALGTDGAPCNNTYDMLREMHLAAMLHKGVKMDAAALGAHEALEMATICGARALGLEADVGSLAVGKKADLAVVDVRQCWAAPWDPARAREGGMDPVSLVVGSCTGRDVELVMVDGEILVEHGALVNVDEVALSNAARRAARGIQERSGIRNTPKEGWLVE